jgi:putative ABC transport system substrate-binding protein
MNEISSEKRRLVLATGVALLATACGARAQQGDRQRVLGYLSSGPGPTASTEGFRKGMRELGWVEGGNLRVEYRWAQNKPERLAELAQELIRLKVEIIVCAGTPSVQAAKNATSSIPIVMGTAADAEGSGFVKTLAKPGGNITGLTMMMSTLAGKRLELLKEITPSVSRVAYLAWGPDPAHKLFLKQTMEAGQKLRIRIQPVIIAAADQLPAAFASMRKERAEAVVVQPLFTNNLGLGKQVAQLAFDHNLSNISDGIGYVEAGGLIYYGPDADAVYIRIAGYVDRILKGSNPAEMPVEQPQKFLLQVNLGAARKLGLRIPQSLLLRADKVIE